MNESQPFEPIASKPRNWGETIAYMIGLAVVVTLEPILVRGSHGLIHFFLCFGLMMLLGLIVLPFQYGKTSNLGKGYTITFRFWALTWPIGALVAAFFLTLFDLYML